MPKGLALNASTGTVSGTTSLSGNFSFTAQVQDASLNKASRAFVVSMTTSNGGNFDGPAELPRVYLQTTLADTPAPGKVISVNAGGDFQAALDSANCGDTIQLQSGASFPGKFTLPAKSCDDQHWIIIRTSAADSTLPTEGSRLTPCYAGVSSLPGRPSFNCTGTKNVMAQVVYDQSAGNGPMILASGANHYRFLGLEITRLKGTGYIGSLVSVSSGFAADHIILDRVWMHGTAQDETNVGIGLNGMTSTAVIDSFFTDFHCTSLSGSCTDSHATSGGSGDLPGGPYKIVGNFLEAAGENIIFGGGPATLTPADIEVRRNHLFKPLIWLKGQPGFVGGSGNNPFVVKNLFELKNAQRVLFEANILEYSWGGFSQNGYAILLTPKNQWTGKTSVCPICQVTDVTIRYSTVSHTGAGIQTETALSGSGLGGEALAGERFSIHDVTLDDINSSKYVGTGTLFAVLNGWSQNVLNNVSINHITAFPDPTSHFMTLLDLTTNPQMSAFTFTNNLVTSGIYPMWSAGGGSTNCAVKDIPITSLSTCFAVFSFSDNALIAVPSNYPPNDWPAGNYFPADTNAVQFVNYKNGIGGDYHLLSSSPYKHAGSDGKDLGADIDAILAATSGVY